MSEPFIKPKKKIYIDISQKINPKVIQNHDELQNLGFDESGHIGFQRELTDENKLNADLVDDSNSLNKFTNSQEKTKLAGIESSAQVNIIEQITVNGVPAQVDANKNVNLVILLEAGVKLTYVGATGVLSLLDEDNNVLSTVNIPLVQRGYYDSTNKNIVLVLANQDTIVIPVADVFTDLASLSGDNTFTGENTFDSDAYFNGTTTFSWEVYYEDNAYFQGETYFQDIVEFDADVTMLGDIIFYGNSIIPERSPSNPQARRDLGTSQRLWRTIYVDNISDGTNTLVINDISTHAWVNSQLQNYHDNTKQDLLSGSSSIDITSNVVSVKQDYIDSQFLSDNEMATLLEEVFD